jgi:hypothetical protein
VRLYWANNDGLGGHVFLGANELELLEREMLLQGIVLEPLEPGAQIPAELVASALETASPKPLSVGDPKLWADWLSFLEGAASHGGLVVR